jgi:CubicO group peptidase (beta-lactamase class C family)
VLSGLPGAVAVASGPGLSGEGAAGLANVETGEPLTVEHRFRVASVTKLFIATAVLQLVDEGAFALDDDAGPIVADVTVRQLLNHTSGLPNFDDDLLAFFEPYRRNPAHRSELGPREVLALALERPRLFAPGEGWAYTGSNYQALGLLVEETTGTPLREELKRRIFGPLGLDATDLPAETWPVHGLARQYLPADNPMFPGPGPDPVDVTELDLPFNWAGGGIVSSGRDLARFLRALLGGELLQEDLRGDAAHRSIRLGRIGRLWPRNRRSHVAHGQGGVSVRCRVGPPRARRPHDGCTRERARRPAGRGHGQRVRRVRRVVGGSRRVGLDATAAEAFASAGPFVRVQFSGVEGSLEQDDEIRIVAAAASG